MTPASLLVRSLAALGLVICLLFPAAGQGKSGVLPGLEKERNQAIRVYLDTGAELDNLERRLAEETKALNTANANVRKAEADGGPFAAAEIQRRRRKARTIANRKAALMLRRGQLTPRHEFERVAMINARSAYASRLMEVAYVLGRAGEGQRRTRQIRAYTELALGELSAIAKHRTQGKQGSDLGQPVPPLGPYATPDEMEWRVKAYQRQIKTFTSQLKTLKPREDRLKDHVKHLAKLLERGYALPELNKTLERERAELTQVESLRRAIEKQTSYYQKLAVQLRDRLDANRAKRSGEKK